MPRPRKNPVQVDENGNEYIEETVTAQGNTGRVYPPKDWIGHRVRITKLDWTIKDYLIVHLHNQG